MGTRSTRLVLWTALTLLLALASAERATAAPTITVYDGSAVTIRPDMPLPAGGGQAATVSAAGNEFADFQIAIQADASAIGDLTVSPGSTALSNPGGTATIPMTGGGSDVTIYREATYDVTQASDVEGGTGEWPDALIPAVDPIYRETRNAFPYTVPANGEVTAWVDVFVPAGQPAGTYSGSIDIDDGATSIATVPINLTVRPFALPATSSLGGAFNVDANPYDLCRAYTGSTDCNGDQDERWLLGSLYARVGLENRISISNPAPVSTDSAPNTTEQSLFNTYILPLVNGTGDVPGVVAARHLAGAKLTSLSVNGYDCGSACLSGWKSFATTDGFAGQFIDYACDEPSNSASASCTWAQAQQRIATAHAAWPGLPTVITTDIADATANGVSDADVLTPIVEELDDWSGEFAGDQRANYDAYLDPANNEAGTAANQLWTYTSCESFGCDGYDENSQEIMGFPGYTIDEPAADARALPWLAYEYGVSGEVYYSVTEDLATAWQAGGLDGSGGHGDGTLFYPGTTAQIGGQHDIPIESIRLKRIRDGRQDYEYLKLAAAQNAADTQSIVEGLFGTPDTAMHSVTAGITQQDFDTARAQLSDLIAPVTSATCRGSAATVVGTDGPDTLEGGGDQVISGLGGNDLIENLTGSDIACGDDGYDTFRLAPDANLNADDTVIDGGADANMLDLSNQSVPWDVNLASNVPYPGGGDAFPSGTRSAVDVALVNITDVTGTPSGDLIDGDPNDNYIVGDGGGDTISSAGGNDVVDVRGSGPPDTVDCGDGQDIVYADPNDSLTNCEEIRLPPACSAQSPGTSQDAALAITLSCTSNWGAGLRYEILSSPDHGTLSTPGASASVTYTPAAGFTGTDEFTFTADDGAGPGTTATVTIKVVPRTEPPPTPSAPANIHRPAILGHPAVGQTLQATTGTWNGAAGYTYQWESCAGASCRPIGAATKSAYVIARSDRGLRLTVIVTARNTAGTTSAAAPAVGPVQPATPTTAQIVADLRSAVAPPGQRIRALLKTAGRSFSFHAPAAGALTVRWLASNPKRRAQRGKQPAVVASTTRRFGGAQVARLTIRLTPSGRRLLGQVGRGRLTAEAGYRLTTGQTAHSSRTFTVRR